MAKRKTQSVDADLPPQLRDDYEPLQGKIVASGSAAAPTTAGPANEQSHVLRASIMSDRQAGVRFHFNYQTHTAEISFDEKPSPEVRSLLKDNGYRWDAGGQVWTFPIKFEQREQDRLHAKKTFHLVTALIRQEKGIEAQSQPIPD